MPRGMGNLFGYRGSRNLPTTRWTLIVNAGRDEKAERDKALAELCELYWPPVYAFILAQRRNAEDARDLTQGFFTSQLIEKNDVAKADRERGKFRSWLFKAVNNYVRNQLDKAAADKVIPESQLISIDTPVTEGQCPLQIGEDVTPEFVFDRQWALVLLGQALQKLQSSYKKRGEEKLFAKLLPLLTPGRKEAHRNIAEGLEKREETLNVALHRFRKQFQEYVRDEVAETVAHKDDLEEELRHLYSSIESRRQPTLEVTDTKHYLKARKAAKEVQREASPPPESIPCDDLQ